MNTVNNDLEKAGWKSKVSISPVRPELCNVLNSLYYTLLYRTLPAVNDHNKSEKKENLNEKLSRALSLITIFTFRYLLQTLLISYPAGRPWNIHSWLYCLMRSSRHHGSKHNRPWLGIIRGLKDETQYSQ